MVEGKWLPMIYMWSLESTQAQIETYNKLSQAITSEDRKKRKLPW